VARAARAATETIPVVFVAVNDPVAAGLVTSLAQPGGNLTGVAMLLPPEFFAKQVDLLKQALPALTRAAVLTSDGTRRSPAQEANWQAVLAAAERLRLELVPVVIRSPADFDAALTTIPTLGVGAVIDPGFGGDRANISTSWLRFMREHRIPVMTVGYSGPSLFIYQADARQHYRRAADYVDRILKGSRPADLPVELPAAFELVVGLGLAREMGLTLPPAFLAQATRVVE
jgi:putative ABC transport system substrate-binding protein